MLQFILECDGLQGFVNIGDQHHGRCGTNTVGWHGILFLVLLLFCQFHVRR